ncbi:MAG: hypothetical protein CMP22_04390 [Rickettsiales bacterium]|nr:hypothetical protein [Rickettsiales bacterium]
MQSNYICITGGASGIGRAIAFQYASNNHRIVIIDIDKEKAIQTVGDIREKYGTPVNFYECDLTNEDNVKTLAETIEQDNIFFSSLISCAGRAIPDEFDETSLPSPEIWDQSIYLNLNSHYYFTYHFEKLIDPELANKSILYISSVNAIQAFGLTAYSAAKAGLIGLMQTISAYLGKRKNTRVNAILPGTVRPSNDDKIEDKNYDALKKNSILGKMAEEEDIAKTAYALTQDLTHITAQTIVVDGGQTMIRSQKD